MHWVTKNEKDLIHSSGYEIRRGAEKLAVFLSELCCIRVQRPV